MRLDLSLLSYAGLLGWLFGPLLAYEWRKARREGAIVAAQHRISARLVGQLRAMLAELEALLRRGV